MIRRCKTLPLSTVRDRILDMALDTETQQIDDMLASPYFSIACDETTDIGDVAQLAIFVRYLVIRRSQVVEELLTLCPPLTTTRGEDIFKAVLKAIEDKKLDLNRLLSITTDGAPAMVGKRSGFVTRMQEVVAHPLLGVHCIIHIQALSSARAR